MNHMIWWGVVYEAVNTTFCVWKSFLLFFVYFQTGFVFAFNLFPSINPWALLHLSNSHWCKVWFLIKTEYLLNLRIAQINKNWSYDFLCVLFQVFLDQRHNRSWCDFAYTYFEFYETVIVLNEFKNFSCSKLSRFLIMTSIILWIIPNRY